MKQTRMLVLGCLLVGLFPAVVPAGDGVVALRTADPSCPDDTNAIYVDCGNGTVTDNRTGLVWLKNANCIGAAGGGTGDPLGRVDWFTAMEFAAGLSDKPATSAAAGHDCGLSDGSSPGEWRLPSVEEWEAMIDDANGDDPGNLDCSPSITSDDGNSCWDTESQCANCSFTGVMSSNYWACTTNVSYPAVAWFVRLANSLVSSFSKTDSDYAWPVRGGQ